MGYVLSPKARADLDGIWDYTAERWDADQADRYVRRIAEMVSRLADGGIVVVRVLHQRMDPTLHA